MSDKKKSVEDIIPEDEKKNLDKYPDHLKSPLFDIKDRKEVLKDATQKEE